MKPTSEELENWQTDYLGGLPIAGGPASFSWKRYSANPVTISLPLWVIIDPADMTVKHHGYEVDETVLEALIRD